MAEACTFFETPITGGNVSLYNETLGDPVYPSPVMGIVGLMKTTAPVGVHFRTAGKSVILLGGIGASDAVRMGGTQFAKAVLNAQWGLPPALDMEYEKRVQTAMREIVEAGLAESAHDLSDGGLAVALAESSFGPADVGAELDLDSTMRAELLLFHEGPSRILISTAKPEEVATIARKHNVEAPVVGATIKGRVVIRQRGKVQVDREAAVLKQSWAGALEKMLRLTDHA
jgi:phosphoribosylformylglycinamidine synthase subunit PurL